MRPALAARLGKTRGVKGALIATVAITFAASSCQSLTPRPDGELAASTVPDPAGASTEWVLVGDDVSMYLRWRDEGGQLAGVVRLAERNATGTAVDVRAEDFVGAANGGQLVLTAETQQWSGASTTDALMLSWARTDGARQEIMLQAGTAADFEAALAAMRSSLPSATTATSATPTSPPAVTTTTPAGPGATGGPSAEEVRAAAEELDALPQSEDVAAIEASLDVMEALAGDVGGGSCPAILVEIAAVQDAAEIVERRLRTLETRVDDIERQRDVVNLLGVAYADGETADPAVVNATGEALARADAYLDDIRDYRGDVRAVVDDVVDGARSNFDDC